MAALALGQPSHKFEKEGVLFVREKQEGFFRRSESKWEFFKGRIHLHLTDRPSVECVLYKLFLFSSEFIKTLWSSSTHELLTTTSLNSDEK